MIKIIDSLYLTEEGCCIKNRKSYPVHIRQGSLDGACSIYSLMMYLMILKTIRRNELEDLYDNIEKSSETENLFHEFFDKHGLLRNGLYFHDLKKLINRVYGSVVTVVCKNEDDEEFQCDGFIHQIKSVLDTDSPIMLGIDYKGGGAHAVLAIGYEADVNGMFNIFCLDPGYDSNPTSYWNIVISLNSFKGKYKHQCLTHNPYNCPAIYISETLVISKK